MGYIWLDSTTNVYGMSIVYAVQFLKNAYYMVLLIQGAADFFCKGAGSAYFSFVGNMVSVTTT